MSKAFTKETDGDDEDDLPEDIGGLALTAKNYMTPQGFARMREELNTLMRQERPEVVKVVTWAAANGDRSENGDYLYGKKRLREIDRRLAHLARMMKAAKVVDPAAQPAKDEVRFGATVELADEDDNRRTVTIVGDDEADASAARIGWSAPLARALIGAGPGDLSDFGGKADAIEVTAVTAIED